ncbi:MAG: hypothetical protein HQL10_10075 [Nitrospirae bacterium]|nr:hypothetical protein [Nitrospirota bacterium]
MIKINLLTVTEEQKKKKKKKKKAPSALQGPKMFLIILGATTGLALLIAGGGTAYLMHKVSSLKDQIETNKKTLADLEKQAADVIKLEDMKKEMEQFSGLIETLSKKQSLPVTVLDDMSSMLPEGVWLTVVAFLDKDLVREASNPEKFAAFSSTMEYKDIMASGKAIYLEGYAFTNNDIVSYIANIKKKYAIAYLAETKREEIAKTPVYKFMVLVGG